MRRQLARSCTAADSGAVPIWLKLGYGSFVGLLIPVYWREYGPGNFLWLSDIALGSTATAVIGECPGWLA